MSAGARDHESTRAPRDAGGEMARRHATLRLRWAPRAATRARTGDAIGRVTARGVV